MAIASYDQIIAARAAGQIGDWDFFKVSTAPLAAGIWHSDWTDVGMPGSGNAPGAAGSGTSYDGSGTDNNGGMTFASVAGSGFNRYGISFEATSTQTINLRIYDRLVATSGLVTSGTGSKTMTTVTLPRFTSGVGVQAWIECTTAPTGTTPVIHLLSYTGSVNGAGQVGGSLNLGGLPKVGDMLQLPLASGDTGVVAVSTINVDTAGTGGAYNLVLMKQILTIPLTANVLNQRDLVQQIAGFPQIFDTACLALMWQATGTTAPNIWGTFRTVYG